MLTYSFAGIGSDSLYEHLYKCIKNDILQGILTAGEKLPSKRNFAKNLGISTITVENAYAQLMAEGYIYSIPKKGYFISDIQTIIPAARPADTTWESVPEPSEPECFADFTSNQTSSEYFPFSIWSRLIRELLNERQQNLMINPPCGGILELREAIARHLQDFHGLRISPDQVIIGAGTEYLYGILIQLLGFDKKYAVEDPGYHKIAKIYKSHNVSCEYISMDDGGIRIPELEEKNVDIIHISPSHQFPTGITMPIGRRYELLGWVSKSGSRYIIEDDYDSEFRLTGQPIPTLQSIDIMEKVIYMNTFTKTLASTVRISYMVLPKHLVKAYYAKLRFYSCTVSNFEQYTLAAFINKGHFEKHINRLRNYYHDKRDALLRCIRTSALAAHISISGEDAGLHFLMHMDTELSDAEFCRKALTQGVKISALSQYYTLPPSSVSHVFIINYSSLTEDAMEKAVDVLYRICLKTT
ncbi:MAG: PLP-dependent aminotransferase family protein [Coprococcus sp.]